MKIDRSQLKKIVKECLVEILQEGVGNLGAAPARVQERTVRPPPAVLRSSVDQKAKQLAKASSGGDSVLESILADTARTTLVQQSGAEAPAHLGVNLHGLVTESLDAEGVPSFDEEVISRWNTVLDMTNT